MASMPHSVEAASAIVVFSMGIFRDFTVSSAWGESGTLFDSAEVVPRCKTLSYSSQSVIYSIATESFTFGKVVSDGV